ncbi:reverse transcriptase [Gossypium australe]|uniref:Reverse transcriptase n=1 Tax=Gossypium australe TaxID=47621 RepID=A0A5B6UYQ3_9ROSI|nr:reverse transcriptase [Gossypium australe]
MEMVRLKCGFENGIDIGSMGSKGGLSLGWRGNSLVNLISFSSYHIDVEIDDKECGEKWRLTGFYGNPKEQGRKESWNLLRHLGNHNNDSWVVLGDFNEIANSFEKQGGRRRRWFTWERGKFSSTNIRERLDHGVATLNWSELFPNAQVEHLTHSFLDHCPLLLDTMGAERPDYKKNQGDFRFEANWCLDSSFEELVRGWWADSIGSIPDKLEAMGCRMQDWSRRNKKDDKRKWVCLENRLNFLFTQEISDDILAEIVEVQLDLNLEADKEELYWAQRARVNWLKNGDRNTSFFHKMTGQRKTRNRIVALEDDFGNRFSTNEDMVKVATDYFAMLFSASEVGYDEHIFYLVEKRVTNSMNGSLSKQFTEEDICNAVKTMPSLKAPGVDGFVATFFQRYWNIVGPDISGYCLDILNGQKEIGAINKTRLVLIPKIDNTKNMSQFRPISLCNVIYKIIAKVLVNRISDILGVCINEAQGAFIPGRLISDNVLIAYEVLHSLKMKKKGRKGNFALKLDMSKAYNRVEWDFLAGMMKALGFNDDRLVLIMRCVTSVSYSVSFNGMSSDYFHPTRGLRQGDPLSPYLFLLCAEGFSTLLEDAKKNGRMRGAPIGRERFTINHLFFADDCILFGDATYEGACTVRDIIREYEMCAGQKVNYDKSLIYYGANVKEEVKEDITRVLGVRVASSPEKYLGLLMMVGRKKAWAFANFKDRFRKRVEGWNLRYLSIEGKEVFIKSVLQVTPLYATQCFLFPKTLCLQLENIMNRFWWANNKIKSGIYWSGWNTLCLPKLKGARVLKARYFPFTDILAAKIGSYPSLTWRSICNARELIEEGLLWRIGKGDKLIQSDFPTWNEELLRSLFDEDNVNRILSIPISDSSLEDTLVWAYFQIPVQCLKESMCATRCFARAFVTAENQQKCIMTISLWSLWFRRNKLIHEGDQWKAPEAGIVKINFDASFLSKDRMAFTAVIARNSTGSILGAETYLFENIEDPFVTEARACERALLFAKTMDFKRLAVEGDALSVIKTIKKRGKEKRLLRSLEPWVTIVGGLAREEGRAAVESGWLRGGFLGFVSLGKVL